MTLIEMSKVKFFNVTVILLNVTITSEQFRNKCWTAIHYCTLNKIRTILT